MSSVALLVLYRASSFALLVLYRASSVALLVLYRASSVALLVLYRASSIALLVLYRASSVALLVLYRASSVAFFLFALLCRRVHKIAKKQLLFCHVCPSVHMEQLSVPLDGYFMKFDIWVFFENPSR